MMDEPAARTEIARIFGAYRALTAADQTLLDNLTGGKLYELYVLSYVVTELSARGFHLSFHCGPSLQFKASPGKIWPTDPHFELSVPGSSRKLWVFVDIEFETLGADRVGATDNSRLHEVDIVVVDVDHGNPRHDNIFLGVECKAVANFKKSILKEVLGVRRELSLVTGFQPSTLSALSGGIVNVPADPPSEYWLAYIDPAGDNYSHSPAAFGIEFVRLAP